MARSPYETHVYHNLEYARTDEKPLLLDLYVPQSPPAPLPLVVFVHGGGWSSGSKDYPPTEPLTAHGLAVASISYRFSQEAIFPAPIHDCKGAVRWLRAHAAQYRLDPDRFGAWGTSAGGHLVALLGTSGEVADLEGTVGGHLDQSSRVQAVCDYFGPTDFLAEIGQPSDIDRSRADAPEARLVGGLLVDHVEEARRANPITYVTADDPPFRIVHGDSDRSVPLNQSQLLHEALLAAGVPSTLHVIEGAGHGFPDPEIGEETAEFFAKWLRA
jgi:acetyl esterase/lipase